VDRLGGVRLVFQNATMSGMSPGRFRMIVFQDHFDPDSTE